MTSLRRRVLYLLPLAVSVGWLLVDAPGPVLRELWFLAVILAATVVTRSVTWGEAVFALSLGIGLAAPLTVLAGWVMVQAGLDVSESVIGSWLVVPPLEELIKLIPVFVVAGVFRRRARLLMNPSDWLLIGCAAGAGFAMVENAQLVRHDAGVLRDVARQYGPNWLVPGAWGATGFVGHAAATGMVSAGIGLGLWWRRLSTVGRMPALAAPLGYGVPFVWITLEHMLANLRVNTGSDLALWIGNGRLTPWLFLALAGVVIVVDFDRCYRVVARSRTFRVRLAMVRASITGGTPETARPVWHRVGVLASELRLINAAAWVTWKELR